MKASFSPVIAWKSTENCLQILVSQKKESHAGLNDTWGEEMMTGLELFLFDKQHQQEIDLMSFFVHLLQIQAYSKWVQVNYTAFSLSYKVLFVSQFPLV